LVVILADSLNYDGKETIITDIFFSQYENCHK